jgi:hypothetical protein
MAAGGLGRIALAGCLLALAALLVTTTGGGGLRGALGSLFGFHGGQAPRATTTDNGRSKPGPGGAQPFRLLPIFHVEAPAPVARQRARRHRPGGSHQRRVPGQTPAPSTSPVPQAPSPPRPPTPPSQGLVGSAGQAIEQAAPAVPAPAQPVVHDAVGAVVQVCGLLGQCP